MFRMSISKFANQIILYLGQLQSYVNQKSNGSRQLPSTEGDRVELTCTVNSTSLPAVYRPKAYITWYVFAIGGFKNISSGQATNAYSGELVPGYSINDNGKTLVIASAQYRDTQGIRCDGQ